jgi:hypothetical protein
MPRNLFSAGYLPLTRFLTRFILSLLCWLVVGAFLLVSAKAAGPLGVGSTNPRLFVDSAISIRCSTKSAAMRLHQVESGNTT